ncbi:MAG TPA: ATP-dependent DNA helicase [Acidimicrobiales bacterium]|jgi:ATP-dependent DNA helicase DinG|nr:ATP-dependent DNA helicase [Acidimicrobiales bacterium]
MGVAEALERVVAALPGGGEARRGQLEMAEAVESVFGDGGQLVVQAGTGTGKGLAYLVPAILSGKTTVVATATKALQDQLANKDLPFLQEHLGKRFEFAVVKGRANYLCLQRAVEIGSGDEQLVLDDVREDEHGAFGQELLRLLKWAKTSKTGDRAELDFEPRARAWAQLSVSARECPGAVKCPQGESCFAEGAHQRAAAADVIVVNTHLYATHLAVGGWLLPEHEAVVFDEAHALEDIAASAFGIELTEGRFTALGRSIRANAAEAADAVEAAGARLADALDAYRGRRVSAAELERPLNAAGEAARAAQAAAREAENDENKRTRVLKAATTLIEDVAAVQSANEGAVVWIESGGPPTLRLAPIDVAHLFAERLWENVPTAVLTSATVPSNLPARLGLPATNRQLSVDSPFDYENQSLLYCATHLPDPRKPEYEAAMHEELWALIKAAGGRTLALFTSWRAMRAAAEAVAPTVPYRVLTQDELPKPALLTAFSTDETSCLFATMGFWQGVDVPGAALSLLVIDKLPFSRPDEPLMQARRDRAGAAAFRTVDLPRAASLLAQGAGRLIRSTADRGVVAVLDSRLATAGYRWELIQALPPMRRTKERPEVERFLESLVEARL